jgi:hypothetical protein
MTAPSAPVAPKVEKSTEPAPKERATKDAVPKEPAPTESAPKEPAPKAAEGDAKPATEPEKPATKPAEPAPAAKKPAAAEKPAAEKPAAEKPAAAAEKPPEGEAVAMAPKATVSMKMVTIELELPTPAFRGTPVPLKEPNVEKPRGGPRPPFLAPEGTANLSRGKPVATSDPAPPAGEVDFVTDGDKEASDFGYLELRPGSEWVQIDLGKKAAVYAVVLWHNHADARVYRDVVVQVSDDPDFLDAQTVFNNDYDNTSGLGIGKDMGYVETSEGKLIDCRGVEGRYIRLYSKGSHIDGKNHYTEVEVFGRPAA